MGSEHGHDQALVEQVGRRLGLDVVLRDSSAENVRTASGLGAGRPVTDADRPQLVVVAVPPAAIADATVDALLRSDAVVTDVGAPLSHAAIVARELGIPAVVGCGNATMRLHTGDWVRVDGGQGTVELLSHGV